MWTTYETIKGYVHFVIGASRNVSAGYEICGIKLSQPLTITIFVIGVQWIHILKAK